MNWLKCFWNGLWISTFNLKALTLESVANKAGATSLDIRDSLRRDGYIVRLARRHRALSELESSGFLVSSDSTVKIGEVCIWVKRYHPVVGASQPANKNSPSRMND